MRQLLLIHRVTKGKKSRNDSQNAIKNWINRSDCGIVIRISGANPLVVKRLNPLVEAPRFDPLKY